MNKVQKSVLLSLVGAASGAAAAVAYIKILRPWMQSWGAQPDELTSTYAGEELLPNARIDSTLGVTVNATPALVWPWLVQLGQDRAGFYSYEWIENAMGLEIHNADTIIPEWQQLEAGDQIMLAEDFGVPVVALEPERALVLHGDTRVDVDSAPPVRPGDFMSVLWGFYLYDVGDGRTRLVTRWKADWNPTLLNFLAYHVFLEPGAFLMLRRMLLGIKQRAEYAL